MAAPDGALLERWIAARDGEAFNELVSRHADFVYGVCRRIVRNDADAQDLTQECFLKLAGATEVPRSSFAGWLHRVATRSAIDLLRATLRRRHRERKFAEASIAGRPDASDWEQLQQEVDACIALLPGPLREVIIAHFLERKPQEEVARSLGVSRQTVTYRLRKGIERLRVLLKKRGRYVSGAALAALLGTLPLEAAPPALLASLGRLALAGPPAAAIGAAAAIPVLFKVGGFLVAKKLVISAVAAMVLILAAGYLAFRDSGDRVHPAAAVPNGPARRPAGTRVASPPQTPGPRATGREAELSPGSAAPGRIGKPGRWRVLDADRRPVPQASVVAAAGPPGQARRLLETASDGEGTFEFDPSLEKEITVWAFKSGAGLGASTSETGVMEVVLQPLGGISGRIYDRETGAGIAGLSFLLTPRDSSGVPAEMAAFHSEARMMFPELKAHRAVTDSQGHYAAEDLSPLRLVFSFNPDTSQYVLPGYRLDDATPEILLSSGERRSGVDFALQRGGSIAGTVFGPDGRALPGARVEILHSTSRSRELQCDADGAYRFLGLPANATYAVAARCQGLPPAESPTISLATAEAVEGVDITLLRGNPVRGRFVDDLGQPIAGMTVGLSKHSESDRKGPGYGMAVTGDDGSFSFPDVAAGKHVLRPFTELHLTEEAYSFTMPEDRERSDLEFVLRRKSSGFISGRVVDGDGQPVAGFPVAAQAGGKAVARAFSGEDGLFRLEGLGDAAMYTITGYSAKHWSGRKLAVPLYSTDVTLEVLERGRIAGRVIDAETRRPVENFEVRAVFIRIEPDGGENKFHLKWTPFDSRAGEFLIEGAEPVQCEIQTRAEGYVEAKSQRFTIPAGGEAGEVVIALHRGASLEGVVLDAETGMPLSGVLVRAHQQEVFSPGLLEEGKPSYAPKGVWKLAMSQADGRFQFDGLAPGETLQLAAWKDGYGPAVRTGVTVGAGEKNPQRFSLARAATLAISASFHGGERYEFHALHRQEKPWQTAFMAFAGMDRPGKVELSRMAPGPYRVAVFSVKRGNAHGLRRLVGELRIEIAPGERKEVQLDLEEFGSRFASVLGRVSGPADRRSDLLLHLLSAEDPEEWYMGAPIAPDPEGRFQFSGLPAGKYLILAKGSRGGPAFEARVPVEVKERERLEVEVKVE